MLTGRQITPVTREKGLGMMPHGFIWTRTQAPNLGQEGGNSAVATPTLDRHSGKESREGGRASLTLVSDLPWGLQSLAVAIFACTLRELPQYATNINVSITGSTITAPSPLILYLDTGFHFVCVLYVCLCVCSCLQVHIHVCESA